MTTSNTPQSSGSASTPRKALGISKARKFAEIEGITLSPHSAQTLSQLQASGLKGDALRAAIALSFQKTQPV